MGAGRNMGVQLAHGALPMRILLFHIGTITAPHKAEAPIESTVGMCCTRPGFTSLLCQFCCRTGCPDPRPSAWPRPGVRGHVVPPFVVLPPPALWPPPFVLLFSPPRHTERWEEPGDHTAHNFRPQSTPLSRVGPKVPTRFDPTTIRVVWRPQEHPV